jgi:Zn finger protein HypA/HybF involved in hydrogenase expression
MAPRNETAHEEYSFACMHCGHGWERAYRIQHHTDLDGRPFVTYHDPASGERVPSPLTRPVCPNCDTHVVRIMRAGQVHTAKHALPHE